MDDLTREIPSMQYAPNLRDLGKYRNEEGQILRSGLVYRPDSLTYLADSNLETLRALSIDFVIEIRSAHMSRCGNLVTGRRPCSTSPILRHQVDL
ncbi:tyrosine-protein phosphatase [Steroidobacter denitrificans]|uniref:tyrosine-protein phosphatase n=1 Tax=Steroidobacter denitrificans TaxID=465721 RepID=UPI0009FA8174